MSNQEDTNTIIKSVSPYLTTLSDTSTRDRPVKRRAIESLKKETLQIKTWSNASTAAAVLLSQLVDSLITYAQSDIESVREQTVGILESLIENCEQGKINKSVTEKLLRIILKRLKEETTEEIRVAWMDLCATLLNRLTDSKITVTESELMMDIIQKAGEDPFAEVIKCAAKLLVCYAQHQQKSTDYACDRMIRLALPVLVHKHTAVRVLGIKAMEGVLITSPKGLHLLFEYNEAMDRQPIVPALVYDTSALVRDTLFTALGKMLCQWSPRDRYQYGDRILPIILSGMFDDLPSVQTTCAAILKQVGQNCTLDLLEADIIQTIPQDEQESETMGLKHLVHICFDKSLIYLLDGDCTDFITVRQVTGLDSLKLFLGYAQADDIVKHIKKLMDHLIVVYLNNTSNELAVVQEKIDDIITLLHQKLPSNDIFLDALLSRLDYKYLAAEKNGFPGSMTVLAVITFVTKFISIDTTSMTPAQFERVSLSLEKSYLKEYIINKKETMAQIEHIKSLLLANSKK